MTTNKCFLGYTSFYWLILISFQAVEQSVVSIVYRRRDKNDTRKQQTVIHLLKTLTRGGYYFGRFPCRKKHH